MANPELEIKVVHSFAEVEQLVNSGWSIVDKNPSTYGTDFLMKHEVKDYDVMPPKC